MSATPVPTTASSADPTRATTTATTTTATTTTSARGGAPAPPRHVGYVLKRFPRISETFVAAELMAMRRAGQRVTVFALSRPDEPLAHRFLDDLDVEVVYLPHRPLGELPRVLAAGAAVVPGRPGPWVAAAAATLRPPSLRGWRRLLQATALVHELRAAGVDHVHAHFASTAARLAALAARLGGPPYSVTAHAKDIYHHDVDPARLVETLAGARFVATVSEANVAHLDGLLRGRAPVELVRNSVDLARTPDPAGRAPDGVTVLSVARLIEKKGLDDLVRACGRLAAAGVRIRLELVGDGPLRGPLADLAAAEGADVSFAGVLDHDDVLERFRTATVFALPCVVASTGDRDGLPTAVLEAMAAGMPVVTTALNGLAEAVVDGEHGLVVAERDPEGLAAALGRLLADPALADRLGRAGRGHVEGTFSLERSAARLRELWAGGSAGPVEVAR